MDSLTHFLRLVKQGKHRGSSSGEKQARQLAQCVVRNIPGLDGLAVDGLIEFIRGTVRSPETGRTLARA